MLPDSILLESELEARRKRFNERNLRKLPTEDIVWMTHFALKKNFLLNLTVAKRQISGRTMGKIFTFLYLHLCR